MAKSFRHVLRALVARFWLYPQATSLAIALSETCASDASAYARFCIPTMGRRVMILHRNLHMVFTNYCRKKPTTTKIYVFCLPLSIVTTISHWSIIQVSNIHTSTEYLSCFYILIGSHLDLRGMCLGGAPRMNTKQTSA